MFKASELHVFHIASIPSMCSMFLRAPISLLQILWPTSSGTEKRVKSRSKNLPRQTSAKRRASKLLAVPRTSHAAQRHWRNNGIRMAKEPDLKQREPFKATTQSSQGYNK